MVDWYSTTKSHFLVETLCTSYEEFKEKQSLFHYGGKIPQPSSPHHPIQRPQSKNFSLGGDQHFLHVFPADAKAATADAGDHLERCMAFGFPFSSNFGKMLNSCHFVPGCAVVLGNFGFDDDLGIEFVGNDEIRGLVEAFNGCISSIRGGLNRLWLDDLGDRCRKDRDAIVNTGDQIFVRGVSNACEKEWPGFLKIEPTSLVDLPKPTAWSHIR